MRDMVRPPSALTTQPCSFGSDTAFSRAASTGAAAMARDGSAFSAPAMATCSRYATGAVTDSRRSSAATSRSQRTCSRSSSPSNTVPSA